MAWPGRLYRHPCSADERGRAGESRTPFVIQFNKAINAGTLSTAV